MIEDTSVSIFLLLLFSVTGGVGTLMALGIFIIQNVVDFVKKLCRDKDDHQTLHHYSDKHFCKNEGCKDFASCSRLWK